MQRTLPPRARSCSDARGPAAAALSRQESPRNVSPCQGLPLAPPPHNPKPSVHPPAHKLPPTLHPGSCHQPPPPRSQMPYPNIPSAPAKPPYYQGREWLCPLPAAPSCPKLWLTERVHPSTMAPGLLLLNPGPAGVSIFGLPPPCSQNSPWAPGERSWAEGLFWALLGGWAVVAARRGRAGREEPWPEAATMRLM